jgi:hypothetical protein
VVAVDQALATVPVEVAPDIIQTEEHAEVQIISRLGADKHTSAGIMAAVHTPVVMVAGAAVEKAEKALPVILAGIRSRNIVMDQAVVEGATAVAVLVSR